MKIKHRETLDPKLLARLETLERRTKRVEHMILHALLILEQVIAFITLGALTVALVHEVLHMFGSGYFSDASTYLHHILTIVVGLEFVRMLVDTTPANVLEVLTLAITRHVILSHDDPLSNVACIACIAGLFAIRRFLIPSAELTEDLVEDD